MNRYVVLSGVIIIGAYLALEYTRSIFGPCSTLVCTALSQVSVYGILIMIIGFVAIGIGMRLGSKEDGAQESLSV